MTRRTRPFASVLSDFDYYNRMLEPVRIRLMAWAEAGYNALSVTSNKTSVIVPDIASFRAAQVEDGPSFKVQIATDPPLHFVCQARDLDLGEEEMRFRLQHEEMKIRPAFLPDREAMRMIIASMSERHEAYIRTWNLRDRFDEMVATFDEVNVRALIVRELSACASRRGHIALSLGNKIATMQVPYDMAVVGKRRLRVADFELNLNTPVEAIMAGDFISHFRLGGQELWLTTTDNFLHAAHLFAQEVVSLARYNGPDERVNVCFNGQLKVIRAGDITADYDVELSEPEPDDAVSLGDIAVPLKDIGTNVVVPDSRRFDGLLLDGRRLAIWMDSDPSEG